MGQKLTRLDFGGGRVAEKGLDILESGATCGGDLKPRGFHSPGGSLEKVKGDGALGKRGIRMRRQIKERREVCATCSWVPPTPLHPGHSEQAQASPGPQPPQAAQRSEENSWLGGGCLCSILKYFPWLLGRIC